MRHATLDVAAAALPLVVSVSTAGDRETLVRDPVQACWRSAFAPAGCHPCPPGGRPLLLYCSFQCIPWNPRRTSAAVRPRRGKETRADRDLIKGHATIAFIRMARAASVLLAGLEQRSSGCERSSGAATADHRAAQSRSESSWADLPYIWITLSISPLMVSQWFMKERRVR